MVPTGDPTFRIWLKTPFRQMLFALGATGCIVMPERVAKTPASTMATDYVGSGPFRFLPNEWDADNHAAYAKFEGYVPRQEAPQRFAGGKVAKFDRVEWIVQPNPATAAAALQKNGVDWIEQPLIDVVGSLKKMQGADVVSYDKLGVVAMVVINHLYPPFDNPAVLRAILAAINQQDRVEAAVGDQTTLAVTLVGFFVDGSPMASKVRLDKFGPAKDLSAAQAAIKAAGYEGEKIIFMAASDQSALMAIVQVTQALWGQLGLNVDFQVSDWGTLVSRRVKQDPPGQGGWNAFCTTWSGLSVSNPGSAFPLQAIGRKGWLGWYDNPEMTKLRSSGSPGRTFPPNRWFANTSSSRPLPTRRLFRSASGAAMGLPDIAEELRSLRQHFVLGGRGGLDLASASQGRAPQLEPAPRCIVNLTIAASDPFGRAPSPRSD